MLCVLSTDYRTTNIVDKTSLWSSNFDYHRVFLRPSAPPWSWTTVTDGQIFSGKATQIQTTKVTLNVIQDHQERCQLTVHIRFPISLPLQLCLYLAPFSEILSLISQNVEVTW